MCSFPQPRLQMENFGVSGSNFQRLDGKQLPLSDMPATGEVCAGWYVAYSVKGRFDKADTVEFLIKTEGVTDRNWEGDKDGPAVFYRSIAGARPLLIDGQSRPSTQNTSELLYLVSRCLCQQFSAIAHPCRCPCLSQTAPPSMLLFLCLGLGLQEAARTFNSTDRQRSSDLLSLFSASRLHNTSLLYLRGMIVGDVGLVQRLLQ